MLLWISEENHFSLKGAVNFSESDVCKYLQEAFLKVKDFGYLRLCFLRGKAKCFFLVSVHVRV